MRLFKIILLIVIISTLGACKKDFEETNTNKNNPTAVGPDLLLSKVIKSMMDRQVNEAWGIGNIVVQYHAKIQFVNEDRYNWNEKNDIWNTVYGNYRDLQNMFEVVGDDETSPYYGIGLVLKSWMFAQLTEAYGDVPYSEAGRASKEPLYQPKYDKQEDIYTGILADLTKANELLAAPNTTITLSGDLLFNKGNAAIIKWRKLANSLKLRYLMRISKKKDVSADMQAILSDAVNYPVFESIEDNAELNYLAAAPNQWPLYGSRVGGFDEFRVSKTLTDRLTDLNDPRLQVFGRPTQKSLENGSPEIEGVPNGLSDVDALAYNGGVQGVSRVGYTFACLVCNDAGQTPPVPDAPKSSLMTYPELQFILAEAREKGMITTGDAEIYYENGIKSNFEYWQSVVPGAYGIDVEIPANYLTQPGVVYSGTQEQKLEKIALQKWVSLYFNGLEGWFDWRRTRMPAVVPGPANLNGNKVPIRYIYPVSEQTLNTANRAEAVQRQGNTDDLNTKMWLLTE